MTNEEEKWLDFSLDIAKQALLHAWSLNNEADSYQKRIEEILKLPNKSFVDHVDELKYLQDLVEDIDNKINTIVTSVEATHRFAKTFIESKVE